MTWKMKLLNFKKQIDVIGDIHGDAAAMAQWGAFYNHDILFAAGDVGLLFGNYNHLEILSTFKKYYPNKKVLMVTGNHDDYTQIEALPQTTLFGAKVRKLSNQFFYVERGEVITIDNKTFLCISGADSIDKSWRLDCMEEDPTDPIWWQQEQITSDDINKIMSRMADYNYKVDYVISHDVPTPIKREIFGGVLYGDKTSSNNLWDLANQIDFTLWYCAHLHIPYY